MRKNGTFKSRIYEIIEKGSEDDIASLLFDYLIMGLIVLNVVSIVLESYQNISLNYRRYFRLFEGISVVIFSVEYILRLWTAEYKCESKYKIYSVIRYVFSPMALIDLLAILPFYLPMLIPVDLRFLRILRLTRLLRILKLNRYSNSLKLVGKVLIEKKEELLVTVFVTFILILVASTIMFYIEHDIQPSAFPNIVSSFWWAVATLTTVGYGDVYPVTGWGRVLSGIIAILGIGLVALPTGIISSGFMETLSSKKGKDTKNYCPNCGKKLSE